MSVGADEFKRTKRKPIKSNQMSSTKTTADKQHERATKFYEWLEKMGNIYLADAQRMDRAILIVIEKA